MSLIKHRFESFGGILAMENPPMLVHVDRDCMLSLGYEHSLLWEKPESNFLSAPLEVHFSVTNICSRRCGDCYMDSGERDAGEMLAGDFCKVVDVLAWMGVFHMALGGGEALERPDFFELASYVRDRGIVPNLTTNGLLMTREIAAKCRLFGQVNVSVHGLENLEEAGQETHELAEKLQSVDLLHDAGVSVGLNYVVTRQNFDQLTDVFTYADSGGLLMWNFCG